MNKNKGGRIRIGNKVCGSCLDSAGLNQIWCGPKRKLNCFWKKLFLEQKKAGSEEKSLERFGKKTGKCRSRKGVTWVKDGGVVGSGCFSAGVRCWWITVGGWIRAGENSAEMSCFWGPVDGFCGFKKRVISAVKWSRGLRYHVVSNFATMLELSALPCFPGAINPSALFHVSLDTVVFDASPDTPRNCGVSGGSRSCRWRVVFQRCLAILVSCCGIQFISQKGTLLLELPRRIQLSRCWLH